MLFLLFFLAEAMMATVAGLVAWHFGDVEMVDMLDALGVACAVVTGAVTIVALEIGCYRRTGYTPLTLIGEVIC